MWLFLLFVLFSHCNIFATATFSPDTSDYDAYGLKIAANDILFVGAQNDAGIFLVQFAPYSIEDVSSLQCAFYYDDPTHYVYSVDIGIKQTSAVNPYFYFAGEVVPQGFSDTDLSGRNGTFIGVWINQDPLTVQDYLNNRQPFSCNYLRAEQLEFLSSYGHQEFFVIAVEPYGKYAIGLATDFAFIYQPFPNSTMTIKSSNVVWPNNTIFNPWAADASETFTIVAGFLMSTTISRNRATPTVYLISNTDLTVLSTWSYTAANNSWQSRLTYSDASSWNDKYIMSVKINPNDSTQALIGMSFLNTIFLFTIMNNGTNLTLVSWMDNGQSLGYGKSVTWLTESQVAILVSTYSLDYLTWYSSKIYVYTLLDNTTLPSSPAAVIPNAQQSLPSLIDSQLIQVISTPESLAILDIFGGILLILAEAPGYFAATDTTDLPTTDMLLIISHRAPCIGGTYKFDVGVQPCALCPRGSRNPGDTAATSCINCSSTSFCPLGAVYDMNSTAIISTSQAYAYPRSPELVIFDDILLQNMFSLGSTAHCVAVSPIFWTLMLIAIFAILFLVITSMNWCVHPDKHDQWRKTIKHVFRRTDLLGEGELWIGGLASIIIALISIMAYVFSISYLHQYPAEQVGPSSFACDIDIRNAKFESSLQALAVPISDDEQPIFTLLNEQNFTFQLEFVNTNVSCMKLSIFQVTILSTIPLPLSSCSNLDGILSATVPLPQHQIVITVLLNDIQLVGGVRLGLLGPGQQNGLYELQELNFIQSIYSPSAYTLAQQAPIGMSITMVVNETKPLYGSNSNFDGIWYSTFTYNLNQMFINADSYIMSANLTSTTLSIVISETSYYIKNVQSPIAKQPEIIFHTVLFSIVCLEICALIFVICKLLLIPLYHKIYAFYSNHSQNHVRPECEPESVNA